VGYALRFSGFTSIQFLEKQDFQPRNTLNTRKEIFIDADSTDSHCLSRVSRISRLSKSQRSLLIPKQLTLDNFVNDVLHGEVILAGAIENGFQLVAVRKLDFAAGRINDDLRDEMLGDLIFVTEQMLFEFLDAS
jgi:hypothetical protein